MLERVFAQGVTINPDDIPGSKLDIDQLFSGGINLFLGAIAIAAFAGIIYGGFLYMSAGGDAAQTLKARKSIIWSLVGVVVALLSYSIILWAANFTNIEVQSPAQNQSQQERTSTDSGGSAGPVDNIIE